MKRILLTLNLALVLVSLYFFVTDKNNLSGIHAVSKTVAELEDVAVADEPVVSSGYATIKRTVEKDLQKVFPNLTISGDLKEGRMDLIKKILFDLPEDKLQNLFTFKITQIKGNNRGLGGTNTIIINDYNLSDEEFSAVLVHELGHAIDLGGIQGSPAAKKSAFNDGPNPIFVNDLSTIYYAYSWDDSQKKRSATNQLDFVSGYAMTNPFEDFAESFTYYYYHNKDFKKLAQNNEKLALKYDYMKDHVFDGFEPQTGQGDANPNRRVWDITKLAISI